MTAKVVVIGSGLCGLTAAYRLQQQGYDPIVLEKGRRFGGRTITDRVDGYVNDLGGSLLASSYQEAAQLSDELGLRPLREPFGGKMQIHIDGTFHALDMNRPLLSLLRAPYLNWQAKISLLRLLPTLIRYWGRLNLHDLSAAADLDHESAEAFCLRTVSRQAYDLLLNPLTRAMYGHDCSDISAVELLWILRTFANQSAFAFRGGMGTLTEALAERLSIRLEHEVQAITTGEQSVVVEVSSPSGTKRIEADYCAIATDGKDLLNLYGGELSSRQKVFLEMLCYNPLSLVYFKLKARPDGVGAIVQVPQASGPEVGALAWYHLWGTTKTPDDKASLIFLGTTAWQFRMQELSVAERIEDARRHVLKYYPDLAALEELAEVTPWPRATTVGRVGHYRRLRDFVADMDADSRVQYAGDYLSQSSIGVAVATGNRLAARIVAAAASRCC